MSILTDRSGRLFMSMKEQLAEMEESSMPLLGRLSKAIKLCSDALKELNALVAQNQFASPEEEITFFKTIKPPFLAELIFYAKIYQVHLSWPSADHSQASLAKPTRRHLRQSMRQYKQFYCDNYNFVFYWRTGSTDRDAEYFRLNAQPRYEFLSMPFHIKDDQLTTGYDVLVASMIAFDKLLEYFRELTASPGATTPLKTTTTGDKTTWTDEKVGLMEFAYAVVEKGSCNNGNATITAVIAALELAFNVDLKNHSRVWTSVCRRKTDRPSFLEKLLACFKHQVEKTTARWYSD